ncbi:MAG: MBL fold metallo-hydrolase [Candidatus Syntropharchaeia archaeon]
MVTITIIYDNNPWDNRLKIAWGFSCLIEGKKKVLFDTGGDPDTLIENMEALGKNPGNIDFVVLSHSHSDHTGGISAVLGKGKTKIFLGVSFPERFKEWIRESTEVTEVSGRIEICEDFYSTGEIGNAVKEQSLVVVTEKGLIVITGCAHPGIVNILRYVKERFEKKIYLVLGGFHLGGKDVSEEFRKLGVKKVSPCHCTGEKATVFLEREYGKDFIKNGIGKIIEV